MSYVLFILSGLVCYGVGVVLGHRVGRRKEPIQLPPPGGDLQLYRTVKRQLDELTRERDEAREKLEVACQWRTYWREQVAELTGKCVEAINARDEAVVEMEASADRHEDQVARLLGRLEEAEERRKLWKGFAHQAEDERDDLQSKLAESVKRLDQHVGGNDVPDSFNGWQVFHREKVTQHGDFEQQHVVLRRPIANSISVGAEPEVINNKLKLSTGSLSSLDQTYIRLDSIRPGGCWTAGTSA